MQALAASSAAAQNRIIAADSSVSIELPRSFHPMPLPGNAQFQFADTATESYILVVVESKEDLVGWNLTRHSMFTMGQMMAGIDMPEVVGPVDVTIDANPGLQYEVRGAMQGTRLAYLTTSVESQHSFAHIMAWTMSSRWKANEQLIRDAVGSVKLPVPIGTLSGDVYAIVPGTWAWESDEEPCAGRTQRFEVAEDRTSMKIHHSEPIESTNGETTSVTDYVIEGDGPGLIHTYIPGESRLTDAGDPVKWDLVAVGRNRLAWHRADWPAGGMTGMLRRCAME